MTTNAPSPALKPVQPNERLMIIDVLRGFALLGILLVNMALFIYPFQTLAMPPDPTLPQSDKVVAWLIHFLAEGKFYTLFSLLFGLGFGLQIMRAEERQARFGFTYIRRLLILLAIGLVHALLIWVGDILVAYAALGFGLLFFRKARPRTLLIWAVILVSGLIILYTLGIGFLQVIRGIPDATPLIEEAFVAQEEVMRESAAQAYEVYANGSFAEITRQRLRDYFSFAIVGGITMSPTIFAMFLVGLYFARRRLFHEAADNLPLFRKLFVIGLAAGLPLNVVYATVIMTTSALYDANWWTVIAAALLMVGGPLLSLAYASGLTLLFQRPSWRGRLAYLAPVGRFALTNYLSQSLICTFIFYGYGLGLFGQVSRVGGLLLTFAIFAAQIAISNWWAGRFRYGPAEWVWRTLTYGRLQHA